MNTILGRLIFFLYPDDNIEKQLIYEIFKNEYEIYPVYNKETLLKLLYEEPTSVIFINIDYSKDFNWQEYVSRIKSDDKLNEISVNLIGDSNIETNKELDNIFSLNNDIENVKIKILEYLENNYAKGRRKFIRVDLDYEDKIDFTINMSTGNENGHITNISSSAAVFDFDNKSLHFEPDTALNNIELKIKEKLLKLSGRVLREIDAFDENPYVILFDKKHMNQENTEIIKNYVYNMLQKRMSKRWNNS